MNFSISGLALILIGILIFVVVNGTKADRNDYNGFKAKCEQMNGNVIRDVSYGLRCYPVGSEIKIRRAEGYEVQQ